MPISISSFVIYPFDGFIYNTTFLVFLSLPNYLIYFKGPENTSSVPARSHSPRAFQSSSGLVATAVISIHTFPPHFALLPLSSEGKTYILKLRIRISKILDIPRTLRRPRCLPIKHEERSERCILRYILSDGNGVRAFRFDVGSHERGRVHGLPHCNQAVCVGMMEVTIWASIDQCKAIAWRTGNWEDLQDWVKSRV